VLRDLRDLRRRITEKVSNDNIFYLKIQDCGLVRPRVSEGRWVARQGRPETCPKTTQQHPRGGVPNECYSQN